MNPSPTPPPVRTPNGGLAGSIRRQRPADPLVRPKKSRPRPPTSQSLAQRPNGTSDSQAAARAPLAPSSTTRVAPRASSATNLNGDLNEPYEDFPLVTTKRALVEGLRHHVMRFYVASSSRNIDPTKEADFTRPVRLHRRDPRGNPLGAWKQEGANTTATDAKEVAEEKERERLEAQREERRLEREAAQAQIAPVGKSAPIKKKDNFKRKTEHIYQVATSEDRRKQQALKYEETLPWHLEDFDNKNTWAGTYEAALSDSHVMMIPEARQADGKITNYRLVPLEKWYKFSAKNRFASLSIDEVEKRMEKKIRDGRWFMDTHDPTKGNIKEEPTSKLFTRKGERGERKKPKKKKADDEEDGDVDFDGDDEQLEVAPDADDIDYNYDEAFADDEENPILGGDDEENKEAEEKIKREQREANIFELKEEKDYDEEEKEERQRTKAEKKKAKRIQRALMKRERNYIYEDDSEGNPYSSESESEDSETERLKEEEAKKEEAQKAQDKVKASGNDKQVSGSSTKGTSTPTGRPRPGEPTRKSILKRPGSPNLSEASGNESARKKHKKGHGSSAQAAESGGAAGSSRASSPGANSSGRSSIVKLNVESSKLTNIASRAPQPSRASSFTAGSGSDGEGSGGERSDSARRSLKIKGGVTPQNGSRGASPAVSTTGDRSSGATVPKKAAVPVTMEELAAMIPPEGILMHALVKHPRVKITPNLIDLLKSVGKFDKNTKLITLKPRLADAAKSERV